MKYSIIDIGSNTIRLSVYDIGDFENSSNDQSISVVFQGKKMVGLASFVRKGKMTEQGIKSAISALKKYKAILKKENVDEVFVFATASIRNISNRNSVLKRIERSVGTKIEILSGEDEAKTCYLGAVSSINIPDGILIDIGGGSTEIVIFEKGEILKAFSMPIGSLNMIPASPKRSYINKSEVKRVKKIVRRELKKAGGIEDAKDKTILGVGGTLRAVGKIYVHEMSKSAKYDFGEPVSFSEHLFNRDKYTDIYTPIFSKSIPSTFIQNSIKNIVSKDKNLYFLIQQIVPDRIKTLPYGLIIISTILDETKSKRIILSPSGVREGYLLCKIDEKNTKNYADKKQNKKSE